MMLTARADFGLECAARRLWGCLQAGCEDLAWTGNRESQEEGLKRL